ncbi:MAG: hypothetical protein NZ957_01095 [Thaumarchaeota archaeon]|nr:hypothetical protein [Candidatus Calditenuaceae archaeon]MDW8041187.1 hypothetical protein [Nitrososphaerota archaeon]
MQRSRLPERPEELLPSVRAAICRELLEGHGLRRIQAAAILGVKPSAVTHYLSSKRGAQWLDAMWSSEEIRKMISEVAESLARRYKLGVPFDASKEISELTTRAFSALYGGLPSTGRAPLSDQTLESLKDRIRFEEAVARRVLEVMNKVRNQAIQLVLRQIAADSLRHAEILTLITRGIEVQDEAFRSDIELVEELVKYESEAEEKDFEEMVGEVSDPAAAALLISIDYDERKHVAMLELLLGSKSKGGQGQARADHRARNGI